VRRERRSMIQRRIGYSWWLTVKLSEEYGKRRWCWAVSSSRARRASEKT